MDLWNIKDLEPPPVNSCKVTTKEIDIRLLEIALKDGISFFGKQVHLRTEAALISRAVYRSKMKFRNSKDFKSVDKLSRCLRNYQHLEVARILKTLADSIPRNYKTNQTPMLTKNMMDYVLVRLQGVGKTLCRILEICKIASTLMQQRLRLGHFWKLALIMFASVSRIFVIAKNVLKFSCELYANLLPFSSSLGNAGVRWLPEEYIFPGRLDEWLSINWIDLEHEVIEIPDDEPSFAYLKLTDSDDDDDDVEFCVEYILVKDEDSILHNGSVQIIEDIPEVEDDVENLLGDIEEVDIGEVISLSDTENKTPKQKRKKKRVHNSKNNNFNAAGSKSTEEIIDVGEVIDLSDTESKTPQRKRKSRNNQNNVNGSTQKKRKIRKSSNINANVANLSSAVSSLVNSPSRKRQRKTIEHAPSAISLNPTFSLASTPKKKKKRRSLKRASNLSVKTLHSPSRNKKQFNVKKKKKRSL